MKKLIIALFVLALFAFPCHAQTTITITGTVEDANGTLYANGTGQVVLVVPGNAPGTIKGQPIPQVTPIPGIGTSATFSVTLFPNSSFDQTGTQYKLQFCSATAVCFSTGAATYNASTSVTSTIQSAATILPQGGVTLPQTFTAPGVFTNTQYNTNLLLKIGTTGSLCTPPFGDANYTDGLTACVSTPTSGVTNAYNSAITGRIFINDPTQDSSNGNPNVPGSGIHGISFCEASKTVCEGGFFVGRDNSGLNTVFVVGAEADADIFSNADTGTGLWLIPAGNAQPTTANSFPAITIYNFSSNSKWTNGLSCEVGSIYNPGGFTPSCIDMFEKAIGNNQTSTAINFHASNSSGVDVPYDLLSTVNANGLPELAGDNFGDIDLWLRLPPETFSALTAHFTCNSNIPGFLAWITDGPATPSWGQTVSSGGGTQPVGLVCDGTNWTVFAK